MDKTCGVRVMKGVCPVKEQRCGGCDDCIIGCFNPARMRNPFFGTDFANPISYWWRGMYSDIEWLCAEHYDGMIAEMREMEEMYARAWTEYEEDEEFTRMLENA